MLQGSKAYYDMETKHGECSALQETNTSANWDLQESIFRHQYNGTRSRGRFSVLHGGLRWRFSHQTSTYRDRVSVSLTDFVSF